MQNTNIQVKNFQKSKTESITIPEKNIFFLSGTNQITIPQHVLQNNSFLQIVPDNVTLPPPLLSAPPMNMNPNVIVTQMRSTPTIPAPNQFDVNDVTDLKKRDIPQFFIVETQFIEKTNSVVQNAQQKKLSDNGVIILDEQDIRKLEQQKLSDVIAIDEDDTRKLEKNRLNDYAQNVEKEKKSNDNAQNTGRKKDSENIVFDEENTIKENIIHSKNDENTMKTKQAEPVIIKKRDIQAELSENVSPSCYITSKNKDHPKSTAKIKVIEKSVSIAPPWPSRSRSIQTKNTVKTSNKSIQCDIIKCMYDSNNSEETEWNNSIDSNENETKINSFDYRESKIKIYSNNKAECLVCGEIYDNVPSIKDHVEIHLENSFLCYKCGREFDHENRLKLHENSIKCSSLPLSLTHDHRSYHENTKTKIQFKFRTCPFPFCNHVTYSLLEMYDHVNYHSGEKVHECICGKKFISYEMYKLHRNIRKCKRTFYKFPYKIDRNERVFRKLMFKVYSLKKNHKLTYKNKMIVKNRNVCRYCQDIFNNAFELFKHAHRKHKNSIKNALQWLENLRNNKNVKFIEDEEGNKSNSNETEDMIAVYEIKDEEIKVRNDLNEIEDVRFDEIKDKEIKIESDLSEVVMEDVEIDKTKDKKVEIETDLNEISDIGIHEIKDNEVEIETDLKEVVLEDVEIEEIKNKEIEVGTDPNEVVIENIEDDDEIKST